MPLDKRQNVLGVTEAEIAVVTVNTSSTYTTSTAVELKELKTVDVTVTSVTKDATFGMGQLADSTTVVTGLDVKFDGINIDLATLAAINGSTLVQSGTTPNQKNTLSEKTTDIPALFNLNFKTEYINGSAADFHMEIPCVKGTLNVVTKADDYWTCNFTGKGFARKKDNVFRFLKPNETKADLTVST